MATCAACKNTILFGGVRDGDLRYCHAKCHTAGAPRRAEQFIDDDQVEAEAARLHAGPCPLCHGPGPVDLHYSHTCMSFLVMTKLKKTPIVACRSCGTKKQAGALATTLALGWWGFPWGLVFTPVQVVKNISAMAGGPSPLQPSVDLKRAVLTMLSARLAQEMGNVPPPLNQRGFEVLPPPG